MRRPEIGSGDDARTERQQATTKLCTLNVRNFDTPFIEHSGVEKHFSADGGEARSEGVRDTCPHLAAELPDQVLVSGCMTAHIASVVHVSPADGSDFT